MNSVEDILNFYILIIAASFYKLVWMHTISQLNSKHFTWTYRWFTWTEIQTMTLTAKRLLRGCNQQLYSHLRIMFCVLFSFWMSQVAVFTKGSLEVLLILLPRKLKKMPQRLQMYWRTEKLPWGSRSASHLQHWKSLKKQCRSKLFFVILEKCIFLKSRKQVSFYFSKKRGFCNQNTLFC